MPICSLCSGKAQSLHFGGDANIPGGIEGGIATGYCDACSQAAWLAWRQKEDARRATLVAKLLGSPSGGSKTA